MGSEELPEPPDIWERMVDDEGTVYYYHAKTGRTSWMSEEQAASAGLQAAKLYSLSNDASKRKAKGKC